MIVGVFVRQDGTTVFMSEDEDGQFSTFLGKARAYQIELGLGSESIGPVAAFRHDTRTFGTDRDEAVRDFLYRAVPPEGDMPRPLGIPEQNTKLT